LSFYFLGAAHEGHPGIVAINGRLRTKVWWPGINKQAEEFVKTCKGCTLVSAPNNPYPMKRREIPTNAWVDVSVDVMGPLPSGDYLFVIVDHFSRYKEVKIVRTIVAVMTAVATNNVLKEVFSKVGFPTSITSANGRQFTSEEMKLFCKENNIKIFHTIPYWPQMNGEVER